MRSFRFFIQMTFFCCILIGLSACSSGPKKGALIGEIDSSLEGKEVNRLESLEDSKDVLHSESIDRSWLEMPEKDSKNELLQASLLCSKGEITRGLQDFRKHLGEKKDQMIWTSIGNCYFRHGKVKLAMLHYGRALRIDSNYAPALNNLAVSQFALGQKAEALVNFKMARKANRKLKTPIWNLARIYLRYSHFSSALSELKILNRINPQDRQVIEGMAICYQGMGNLKDATRSYALLKVSLEDSPELLLNFANYLVKVGQEKIAMPYAQKAFEKSKGEDSLKEISLAAGALVEQIGGKI